MKTTRQASNKGVFKTGEQRTETISLRLSKTELDIIDKLCQHRKECGAKQHSRTDVIVLSIKFASGELTILERMEMNLADGKSLFDIANYNPTKYTQFLKTVDKNKYSF